MLEYFTHKLSPASINCYFSDGYHSCNAIRFLKVRGLLRQLPFKMVKAARFNDNQKLFELVRDANGNQSPIFSDQIYRSSIKRIAKGTKKSDQ